MNNVLLNFFFKADKYSKLLKIPKTDASYVTKKTELNAKRNYYFHVFNII